MEKATRTEYLKYQFSEDELREFSKQLARENTAAAEAEDEKKAVVAQFTEKIASAKTNISRLARYINNGYEYRNIDCDVMYNDPTEGKKTVYRKDTGELVKTESMTESERQEALPFEEKKDSEPETEMNDDVQSA